MRRDVFFNKLENRTLKNISQKYLINCSHYYENWITKIAVGVRDVCMCCKYYIYTRVCEILFDLTKNIHLYTAVVIVLIQFASEEMHELNGRIAILPKQ